MIKPISSLCRNLMIMSCQKKINRKQIFQSKSLQLFSSKGWVAQLLFNCLHIQAWVTNTSHEFKKLSICYTIPSADVFSHFLSSNLILSYLCELKSRGFHKTGFREKRKPRQPPAWRACTTAPPAPPVHLHTAVLSLYVTFPGNPFSCISLIWQPQC